MLAWEQWKCQFACQELLCLEHRPEHLWLRARLHLCTDGKARGNYPPWPVAFQLHKSRRQRLHLILIEHRFQERTEDNQAWHSDLGRKAAPNLFAHRLFLQEGKSEVRAGCELPAVVHSDTRLHDGLCMAHMWAGFPSLVLCQISSPHLFQVYLGPFWAFWPCPV